MPPAISPLSHALRLLKVELAQRRNPQHADRADSGTAARRPRPGGLSAATALQRLPSRLKAARSQADGLTRSKAVRLFIEAVLLDELGGELLLDAEFGALVERTCSAIEQDSDAAILLADALKELEGLAE